MILKLFFLIVNFVILQWFFVRIDNKGVRFCTPLSGYFGIPMTTIKSFQTLIWFVTYFSIIGTILNIFKLPVCFVIWIITNAFWSIYNLRKKETQLSFIFMIYLVLSVIGFISWIN